MKQIPNSITILRIAGSVLLFWTRPYSVSFFVLYILCGLSDMLDGWIARLSATTSAAGAVLDSMADFIFLFAVLALILPKLPFKGWMLWWIGGIAVLRFLAWGVGYVRFHAFSSLHTYANKGTGIALFLFPLFCLWLGFRVSILLLCSIASLSAVEELAITLCAKTLDRNCSSFFTALRQKKSGEE